jgi:hypothetical protein
LIGVGLIGPGSGLAAKFLSSGKANKTYVRYMSADRGASGTIRAGATPVFNDVRIEAPTSGVLLIQGSAHFDNQESSGQERAQLTYQVDGGGPVLGGETTLGEDQTANTDPGETGQVSYVDAVPVSKGSHTVRQLVSVIEGGSGGGPPGSGLNVNFSSASLVVTFFPGKGVNLG